MEVQEALRSLYNYISENASDLGKEKLNQSFPAENTRHCINLVSWERTFILLNVQTRPVGIRIYIYGNVKSDDGIRKKYGQLDNGNMFDNEKLIDIKDVECKPSDSQKHEDNKGEDAIVYELIYGLDWRNKQFFTDDEKQKVCDMYDELVEKLDSVQAFGGLKGGQGAKEKRMGSPSMDSEMFQRRNNLGLTAIKQIPQHVEKYVSPLFEVGQIVLTGAPGTGKTYLARELASLITGDNLEGDEPSEHITMCQFHPSFDYSDFVEGLRPVKGADEKLGFERRDGMFMELCRKAIKEPDKIFVFIIDEVNRGDISKIFGELFFSIEKSYRGKKGLKTRYNNLMEDDHPFKNGFYVPKNVYIIGTMNDIDRGVESMDFAIRRRFRWIEVEPEDRFDDMMGKVGWNTRRTAKRAMDALNGMIKNLEGLGKAYQIGPSYFKSIAETLEDGAEQAQEAIFVQASGQAQKRQPEQSKKWELLWSQSLAPLLREYMRGFNDVEGKICELHKRYADAVGQNPDAANPGGPETPRESVDAQQ